MCQPLIETVDCLKTSLDTARGSVGMGLAIVVKEDGAEGNQLAFLILPA